MHADEKTIPQKRTERTTSLLSMAIDTARENGATTPDIATVLLTAHKEVAAEMADWDDEERAMWNAEEIEAGFAVTVVFAAQKDGWLKADDEVVLIAQSE